MRLNKYLADCGIASRRKVEQFILEGRIAVNNVTITDLSFKVNENDVITFDGEKVKPHNHIYILMNKPRGLITSTKDEKSRKTVLDLIKENVRIYPVGRLDYDTTGLLFLTNDGNFMQSMLHPSNRIEREYEVYLDKEFDFHHKQVLINGIKLKGGKGKFISVTVSERDKKFLVVTSYEGRNHFVKLMFSALGYKVIKLHRSKFGKFNVKDLKPGEYKKVSEQEINRLLNK